MLAHCHAAVMPQTTYRRGVTHGVSLPHPRRSSTPRQADRQALPTRSKISSTWWCRSSPQCGSQSLESSRMSSRPSWGPYSSMCAPSSRSALASATHQVDGNVGRELLECTLHARASIVACCWFCELFRLLHWTACFTTCYIWPDYLITTWCDPDVCTAGQLPP